MLYPYKFQPILAERVWGGHELSRFGKQLPTAKPIGESWEISDRPEAQSTIINGPQRGQTLHELIQSAGWQTIVGSALPVGTRFPLLVKLLDARERLSLQVHPPAAIAPALGGEPKTEMWYILDAAPGAHLIAGLKRGVTRAAFETALAGNQLEPLVHRFPVQTGEAMFIPSGRIHAIDAGLVIVEIQQNSDTTYRVYDWGRPREIHVPQSLASIDFTDFEPRPQSFPIRCEHFLVEKQELTAPRSDRCTGRSFHILTPIAGTLRIQSGAGAETLAVGEFALLPAGLGDYTLTGAATFLKVSLP